MPIGVGRKSVLCFFGSAALLIVAFSLGDVSAAFAQRVSQKWVARVDGPAIAPDTAYAIATDSQGNVIVGGDVCATASSPTACTNQELQVEKYSSAGQRLWGASLSIPQGYAFASAVTADAAGNVYVTGGGVIATNGLGALITIKYSALGVRQWIAYYKGPGPATNTIFGSPQIIVDSAGNSYISGFVNGPGFTGPITTIKYSPSGQQLWANQYSGFPTFFDGAANSASGLAVDSSGNVYVTGSFNNNNPDGPFDGEGITIKYSSSGKQLWYKSTDNNSSSVYSSLYSNNGIKTDAQGNLYVVGTAFVQQTSNSPAAESGYVVKYNASGQPIWFSTKESTGGAAIALDGQNNSYVTGAVFPTANNFTFSNYSTSKVSSSGAFEWTRTYNNTGKGDDESKLIVVDAEGDAYVTGQSTSAFGSGLDYATLKYDTNGNQKGLIRYNGPGNKDDAAVAIAASGGNLYVTGTSVGSDGQPGWATLDYVQDADVASPTSLTFSAQKIGTASAAQTVTLKNSGSSGDITFEGIDVHGPFAETNNCPKSLAPQASCTVTVTFKPTGAGTATGSIDAYDQWAGSPAIIALKGAGTN